MLFQGVSHQIRMPAHNAFRRSAGFLACRVADFPVGSAFGLERPDVNTTAWNRFS